MVSIIEEPFAASNQGPAVPRFLVRVFSHCDLIVPLEDMARHALSDFAASVEDAVAPPLKTP